MMSKKNVVEKDEELGKEKKKSKKVAFRENIPLIDKYNQQIDRL